MIFVGLVLFRALSGLRLATRGADAPGLEAMPAQSDTDLARAFACGCCLRSESRRPIQSRSNAEKIASHGHESRLWHQSTLEVALLSKNPSDPALR